MYIVENWQYINGYYRRITRKFEDDFVNYPDDKLLYLVKQCLNGDRSDDGIIKTAKMILRQHK